MLPGGLPPVKRDVIGYTKVITKCKQWPDALAIVNQIKQQGLQLDEVAFGAAVRASKSSWCHAVQILTLLEAEELQLNSVQLAGVMNACEQALQWQLCSSFFVHLTPARLEALSVSVLCSSLIAACGRASELRWALRFLDEAHERGASNVITLSAAITACERSSMWQDALSLLERNKTRCNVVSYSSCMSACARASQWQRAMLLLRAMLEQHLLCDAIIYSACINACGAQWQYALHLLEAADADAKMSIVAMNAAISSCEKGSAWAIALLLLDGIPEKALQANVISENAAVAACGRMEHWQRALLGFQACQPDLITWNARISACERQWQQACLVFQESRALQPDSITFGAMINALSLCAQWFQAMLLLQEAKLAGAANAIIYNTVAAACENAGLWRWALWMLAELSHEGLQRSVVSYGAAMAAGQKAQRWQVASFLLQEAKQQQTRANKVLFHSLLRAGTWHGALNLLAAGRWRSLEMGQEAYVVAMCPEISSQWEWSAKLFSVQGLGALLGGL